MLPKLRILTLLAIIITLALSLAAPLSPVFADDDADDDDSSNTFTLDEDNDDDDDDDVIQPSDDDGNNGNNGNDDDNSGNNGNDDDNSGNNGNDDDNNGNDDDNGNNGNDDDNGNNSNRGRGNSSNQSGASPVLPLESGTGTLHLSFVGCDDGGDWSGPPENCTTPVQAPDEAVFHVYMGAYLNLSDYQPDDDGVYRIDMNSLTPDRSDTILLERFDHDDYNYYTFVGVDEISRWQGTLSPINENTPDKYVTVIYWNGDGGLITPAENTFTLNVWECPEGVDPAADPSPCAAADGELGDRVANRTHDQGLDDVATRDGGTIVYNGLPAYSHISISSQPMTGYDGVYITGDVDDSGDWGASAYMVRNEQRQVDVYYYAPNGSQEPAPTATAAATEAPTTGTLRVLLLSCPEGVTPHDNANACTDVLEDDGSATVTYSHNGEAVPLTSFERDADGAYLITGIEESVTISNIASPTRDRLASDADSIDGDNATYTVEPGTTRAGHFYYFDNP